RTCYTTSRIALTTEPNPFPTRRSSDLTEDPGFQTGESLALQKIEARPVDGREVKPDGSADEEETKSGGQGCRDTVKAGTCLDSEDRKSTRLNSSHVKSSYAVFCLKKKK